MNIIELAEAVKKTRIKSVKRKLWVGYQHFESLFFDTEALLATDWEVEERKIEITESEFDGACKGLGPVVPSNAITELKRRLFEK